MIVYQLAVRAKHKGGTRANPDDVLNNESENFFRASQGRIGSTSLCALPSAVPVAIQIASYGPVHYQHPPFSIPRSAPGSVYLRFHHAVGLYLGLYDVMTNRLCLMIDVHSVAMSNFLHGFPGLLCG